MKVYLQYPWKFPDSPYYKYLIDSPPENIEYLNISKQKGVITSKRFFWMSNFLKGQIRFWTSKFNLAIPNSHESPRGNYDLIHCAHCLSKNKDKPWIADVEGIWQLGIGENNEKLKNKIKKILMDKSCKKILPWTETTKNKICKIYPEIGGKLEVVYPAVPLQTQSKKLGEKINLVFSSRYFFKKGGLEALEVIDNLTKKYDNVYGIINSEIPKKILKKYEPNVKIEFYPLIPQKKLFELYRKSHISVYPGFSDSFGFAYLESMSWGIPIVTVEGFARDEIFSNGELGYIVSRKECVKNMTGKIVKLIENPSLLKKNVR